MEGRRVKPDVVLVQKDGEIAFNPLIGLCRSHYQPLEQAYRDLGWRLVKRQGRK